MIYQFHTDEAYYPTDPMSVDPFEMYWDSETGEVLGLYWDHSKPYKLHPDGGTVTRLSNIHFSFEVQMTDLDNLPVSFPLLGRIAIDATHPPDTARLAAIQEGSGTFWLAASGTIRPADMVPARTRPPG